MSVRAKFLSFIALCAALALCSTVSMAQNNSAPADPASEGKAPRGGFSDHGRGGHGGPGGMMRELRGIDLTDAQRQQIHTIMESNKPDPGSMEQMRTLMDAKRNGTITPEQQDQLKTSRQQAMEKGRAVRDQIRAILTPEQLQQIEKRKQEMKERWQERRQQREQTPSTDDKPIDN